jgi:hypothetical protein
MKPLEEMDQQHVAFLYELYRRSEGNPRCGVPYEEFVEALGFGERVIKSIQHEFSNEGLVDLTAVPQITNVGRTIMDPTHRRSCRQTIGMTPHGVRLMEDILSNLSNTQPPTRSAS